jgi:hypothetical protein
MPKKSDSSNVEPVERRKHWRDRRSGSERRNPARLQFTANECRSGQPRRASDLSGELSDGDIWWQKNISQVEQD